MGLFARGGARTSGSRLLLFGVVVFLLPLVSCLSTGQRFGETIKRVEYSEPDEHGDQYVTAEEMSKVTMKDQAFIPPWKSEGDINHGLVYNVPPNEGEPGWNLSMSAADILKGGDITAALTELKGVIAEARRVIELLHPVSSIIERMEP